MTKYLTEGLPVDFSEICPHLKNNPPKKIVGFIFEIGDQDVLASETACPNGGLPGVERRKPTEFILPINTEVEIVAYCSGCQFFPSGFLANIA